MGDVGGTPAFAEAWARAIRGHREDRGWSQRELGERLGTSQVAVQHWESGRHVPSDRFRPRLVQVLGITEGELYGIYMEGAA